MSIENKIHSRNIFYKEIEMVKIQKYLDSLNLSLINPIEIMKNIEIKILQSYDVK
jgi:hypothetical protein